MMPRSTTLSMTPISMTPPAMRLLPKALALAVLLLLTVGVAGASADKAGDARKGSQAQVQFGILAAQKDLWREALYRWKRAVEIDPNYAAAYNNLAIAYEHEGQFSEARKAYDKALELDPHNQQIQQNYDLFKEINDRSNRSSTH
jgi:Tfp pilus assembly protein PilF